MKINLKKYLKEARVLLLLIIIAFTVKSTLIEIYVVPTGSMENEILVGDLLIGNKFTYGMRTPNWIGIPYTRMGFDIPYTRLPGFKSIENGDVAMFEYPRDPFQKYVKRCIGIPSDTISILNGEITINNNVMPFPENAKYITFKEADLNSDGWINQLDYNMINSKNSRRFQVALRKAQFTVNNQANVYDSLFNTESTILLDEDYQLNPYKSNFVYSSDNKDYPTIQEQYLMGTIYPYFDGNTDNIKSFIVPHKGMKINFKDWYKDRNEWISLITLLVQDGNKVTLDGVEFIMEDPESVAQISGILRYKLFPNPAKQRDNYHSIKADLKLKNKINKKDNPWNIYENPYLYNFESDIKLVKSIDLNQDMMMDESDLVNDKIYKSFITKYTDNDINLIIKEEYDGSMFLFGLNFYKEYADKYIFNNLMINDQYLSDLNDYEVLSDYYLFIGDNRDNSLDSRFWGFVPDYQILGTPLLSLLNISKFKIRFKTIN
ncbi:MAG: signal peptidase I [Candidatus Pelagibacter sp. TMED273]|nr:MAG: signal peptidase I [Candidatus Pelagibacter sp. TMED273]|tara:strand:- start:1484 stop:2953 length:1470 start_codon:yes stop_codon:yes gene_type:complete